MNITQVVFEKGVTLQRSIMGLWQFQTVGNQQPSNPITIKEVADKYDIRPLLITDQLTQSRSQTYLLPIDNEKGTLESQLSQLIPDSLENSDLLFSLFNIQYIIGATIYHCKRLAETYRQICYKFVNLPIQVRKESNLTNFGRNPEPYYEFDALITAARRAYDSTRYILWRVFGPGRGSVPSSFPKTLPRCNNTPSSLATRLKTSWDKYGMKLTDYRDCIQHYAPLDYGLSYAQMVRLDDQVWSTTLLIPDNPEAKSKANLRYSTKIDALSYGWVLTNEIMDVATEIINAIQK
ncbi:MAG: hypothetical protein U9R53_09640 [Chloroflexota bacterium]|nr:hypothetical protein [Chloroflexota bacterium]